ncbi:hypothetical protein H7F10_15915 [Acidithiobacillus sp. HP-6]|uniref:hypothetical protein n=1 Tax=unclassified Acidithiobacillus TaxID=2614800 RepID=UPI00187AA0D2|nr:MULTISPECIES: hypothetical protein [unclassified Acidithiobacillus]MBE7564376.1 hypothetical protein [Acidithiobacillus sp. HP-6]MBE7571007.1 hypothetical protein [Acidithiobacillus sp. HP-2]
MNKRQLPAHSKIALTSFKFLIASGSLVFSVKVLADTQMLSRPPKQPTAPSKIAPQKINSQDDALHTLASALAASPKEGNQTQAILLAAADRGDYLPAISWSLAQKYWSLAEILVANNPGRTPPWVRLSLASHKKDLRNHK